MELKYKAKEESHVGLIKEAIAAIEGGEPDRALDLLKSFLPEEEAEITEGGNMAEVPKKSGMPKQTSNFRNDIAKAFSK